VRHRLALTYVVRLPIINRWTRNVEFQGITMVQSGLPFTPLLGFDNSNTGNTGSQAGSDRPNVVHGWTGLNPTPAEWFDTTAFAVPTQYTFGNAGRNIIHVVG
jgi:hypothetical protein